MRWSLKLGKIAGTELYLHWTFLILLGVVFFNGLDKGTGIPAAAQQVLFVVALFTCIVLHEFGHAFAARRYGIETRDITLLPIGGVARLERMPREPRHELWVALAGPLVNVVIAAALYVILVVASIGRFAPILSISGFLTTLLWLNVFLVAFNLLPAFPMDGGRVLRAMLARRLEYVRATRIAARIGQGMAVLFIIAGFVALQRGNPMLMLIGVFIFIGARNEAHIVEIGRNIEPAAPERPFSRTDSPARG
ncbi:MAG: site-2 protease family protein [Verrucomicrobia subdivision 3 bacterium]|nr:site-2 protease family protein [Limisphaerales bacterium]